MKRLIIIFAVFLLSGCAATGKLLDIGADVNDNALLSAEATICKAASVGSVIRRYNTPEKAKAWKELCTQSNEATPVIINSGN